MSRGGLRTDLRLSAKARWRVAVNHQTHIVVLPGIRICDRRTRERNRSSAFVRRATPTRRTEVSRVRRCSHWKPCALLASDRRVSLCPESRRRVSCLGVSSSQCRLSAGLGSHRARFRPLRRSLGPRVSRESGSANGPIHTDAGACFAATGRVRALQIGQLLKKVETYFLERPAAIEGLGLFLRLLADANVRVEPDAAGDGEARP